MNPFNKIKSKLLAIEASTQMVSRGYALGVFLGTTPFIGTKVFIALGLTTFFRWSRLASVVGVYHINILTAPLFYGLAFGLGQWITGAETNLYFPSRLNFAWFFQPCSVAGKFFHPCCSEVWCLAFQCRWQLTFLSIFSL